MKETTEECYIPGKSWQVREFLVCIPGLKKLGNLRFFAKLGQASEACTKDQITNQHTSLLSIFVDKFKLSIYYKEGEAEYLHWEALFDQIKIPLKME